MAEKAPAQSNAVRLRLVAGRELWALKAMKPGSGDGSITLGGRVLPTQPGACLEGDLRALCTGPGDWLLVPCSSRAASARARIEADLRRGSLCLVDLSDGLAVIEIGGPAAREVLSQGSGLDFHVRAFPPGRCARTRFAQIPLLLECRESSSFDLYVARSYLRYLHSWLSDASGELTDRDALGGR